MSKTDIAIFWHRRDLRIEDNAGLYRALNSGLQVQPIFIFDSNILKHLPKKDKRVNFIYNELVKLKEAYAKQGANLIVRYGKPKEVYAELLEEFSVKEIYTNTDYEPYARKRDGELLELFGEVGIAFKTYKNHVIFEKDEVVKDDGTPYLVYTPYSKKWKAKLNDFYSKPYPVKKYLSNIHQSTNEEMLALEAMNFEKVVADIPSKELDEDVLNHYQERRNFPAQNGNSKLSVHLRFGTISLRKLLLESQPHSTTYVNELIWRDFYQMILWHFPKSADEAIRPKYDRIEWRNNEAEFKAWCNGQTGYPMVDAGMRELNETGYMHNRVRMVVASFLTKHLLIDWRWGERYFAEKLLDFDLASNVGGWQWASGSGCDAAPYFRIFNPTTQLEKFDKQLIYTKKWIPEYGTDKYAEPIVDHKMARERCLVTYKEALNG